MFSPSDAVGIGTNFVLPTVSSPSTVVFLVCVQGENHLVVVVTGELRVRDNRPLGRCAVGYLDAPLVDLDLLRVDLVGSRRPLSGDRSFGDHDVGEINGRIPAVAVDAQRGVGHIGERDGKTPWTY